MMLRPIAGQRAGLTLLEVLVSLAMFLLAMIVMGNLLTSAGDRALEVQYQSRAAQICQTKLAEVNAGIVKLESQNDIPVDEDPDWQWSMNCDQDGSVNGLWTVHITVSRQRPDGTKVETTVSQMLIDPSIRGSSLDAATPSGSDASTSSSDSNGSSSGSSGSGGSGSSTPAAGGAASKPAASGASSSKPAASTGSKPVSSGSSSSSGTGSSKPATSGSSGSSGSSSGIGSSRPATGGPSGSPSGGSSGSSSGRGSGASTGGK